MSESKSSWTLERLKTALTTEGAFDSDEISVEKNGADILEITFETAGQITLFMSVGENQILTTTLLWPRDAQEDTEAFELMMLRNHKKLLPLCALAIEQIDGRDYYELFGAMSIRSSLDSVVTEIRTLANNAIELAQDLGPRSSKS